MSATATQQCQRSLAFRDYLDLLEYPASTTGKSVELASGDPQTKWVASRREPWTCRLFALEDDDRNLTGTFCMVRGKGAAYDPSNEEHQESFVEDNESIGVQVQVPSILYRNASVHMFEPTATADLFDCSEYKEIDVSAGIGGRAGQLRFKPTRTTATACPSDCSYLYSATGFKLNPTPRAWIPDTNYAPTNPDDESDELRDDHRRVGFKCSELGQSEREGQCVAFIRVRRRSRQEILALASR